MPTETWETLQVDDQPMRAVLATPDGAGPFGAVVVIQHAGGVDPFVQEMTRRVAAIGLIGIAPELYHRQTPNAEEAGMQRMGRLRDLEVTADVDACLAYLQQDSRVANDRIGIKGYCMGGRVAYMMAGTHPDAFAACVAFYGGNTKNNWGDIDAPTPFQRLADIACPVLGFFGDDDGNPSPEDREKMAAELTRGGATHEFHSYPNAAHAYMDFTNPNRHSPAAAEASWPIAVEFLGRHLRGAPVNA